VLLLPCGRSAHLEAGWMGGAGKLSWILAPPAPQTIEPELMYGLLGRLCVTLDELLAAMAAVTCGVRRRYEAPSPTCDRPEEHDGEHRWTGRIL
jgi:hypothetical protein